VFNEIVASPYVRELEGRNARIFPRSEKKFVQRRHWVATFHDETLEVVAREAQVLGKVTAKIGRIRHRGICRPTIRSTDRREDAAPG
jgi:hypothetical protein